MKTTDVYIRNHTRRLDGDELVAVLTDAVALMRLLQTEISVIFPRAYHDFSIFLADFKRGKLWHCERFFFQTPGGSFEWQWHDDILDEQLVLRASVFSRHASLIENYCDQLQKKVGSYGFIRAYQEYLENNIADLSQRNFNTPAEIRRLPKMLNDEQESVVDCQKLPGYNHCYKNLLFTSCWLMYLSKEYGSLLPKEIFQEAQQVESCEFFVTSSQLTMKTKLFANVFNWEHPANLNFQKLYQEQIGLYQLNEANGVGVLVEPMIEYQFSEGEMQSIQYFNRNLQPTYKSQAESFLTRTLNFATQKTKSTRSKGVLNARAYFPYLDETSHQLMAYRVLHPERTVDQGVAAYSFYIQHFLQVELQDEAYKNYQTILVFYVPKDALKTLPLDRLKMRLTGVAMKPARAFLRHNPAITFDLKQGERHLRVVFADQALLTGAGQKEMSI